MKVKTFSIVLAILIGICFATNFDGSDQEMEKERLLKIVQEFKNEINGWENTADFLWILTVVVGLLSGFTGVFQIAQNIDTWRRRASILAEVFKAPQNIDTWRRRASIFSSFTICLITLVTNLFYANDYRVFGANSTEAKLLANKAEIKIIQGYPEDDLEARNEWYRMIGEIFAKIIKLKPSIYSQNISSFASKDFSFNLISTAYAQTQQRIVQEPSWLSKPPKDMINLYFVGISDSPSLEKAKKQSFNNAVREATHYLKFKFYTVARLDPIRFDINLLAEYLVASGEIEDIHFQYDHDKNSYRYYTLLKLNKRIAEIDIELFGIRENIYVPFEFIQAMESTREMYEKYYAQKISDYDNFLQMAAETLPPEQFARFMEGCQLRKSGRIEEALELLEPIVHENPTFYFGWYNLALAYDDIEDFEQSNRSYERAAELEPTQPIRDASFYNSYGYFLFRHKRYREAIAQLNKALTIDPDHPEAKETRKAARNALKNSK